MLEHQLIKPWIAVSWTAFLVSVLAMILSTDQMQEVFERSRNVFQNTLLFLSLAVIMIGAAWNISTAFSPEKWIGSNRILIKLYVLISFIFYIATASVHAVFLDKASALFTATVIVIVFFNGLNAAFLSAALFEIKSKVKFIPFWFCILICGYSFIYPSSDDQIDLIENRSEDGIREFSQGSLQEASSHFAYTMFDQVPADFCSLDRLLRKYEKDDLDQLEAFYRRVEAHWEETNEWLVPMEWEEGRCIEALVLTRRINDFGRQPELRKSFEYWLAARPDREYYSERGRRYPVFLVSAQGGGIYAAAHVSYFLSYIQKICPSFAQHIFAISGVSGGSVGAALFAANVSQAQPSFSEPDCKLTQSEEPPLPDSTIEQIISRDHVSPLLGMMLGPDIFEDFIPGGIARFERTTTLRESFGNTLKQLAGNNYFYEGLSGGWNPDESVPALLLNTTEVGSGRRLVLAPFSSRTLGETDFPPFSRRLGDHYFITGEDYKRGLRVGDAAFASARFPFVTGSATIPTSDLARTIESEATSSAAVQLVDGGYSDNSGAETLFELYDLLEPEFSDQVEFFVISFSGTTEDSALVPSHPEYSPEVDNIPYMYITNFDHTNPTVSDAIAPLTAFLGSRTFRSQLALERLSRRAEGDCFAKFVSECAVRPKFMRINLDDAGLGLPLGWTLGPDSLSALLSELPRISQCAAPVEIVGFQNNDFLVEYVLSQGDEVLRIAFEMSSTEEDLANLRQERTFSQGSGLLPDELEELVSNRENCWPILVREILLGTFLSQSDEFISRQFVTNGRW